jgi:hypothetical protein
MLFTKWSRADSPPGRCPVKRYLAQCTRSDGPGLAPRKIHSSRRLILSQPIRRLTLLMPFLNIIGSLFYRLVPPRAS